MAQILNLIRLHRCSDRQATDFDTNPENTRSIERGCHRMFGSAELQDFMCNKFKAKLLRFPMKKIGG